MPLDQACLDLCCMLPTEPLTSLMEELIEPPDSMQVHASVASLVKMGLLETLTVGGGGIGMSVDEDGDGDRDRDSELDLNELAVTYLGSFVNQVRGSGYESIWWLFFPSSICYWEIKTCLLFSLSCHVMPYSSK